MPSVQLFFGSWKHTLPVHFDAFNDPIQMEKGWLLFMSKLYTIYSVCAFLSCTRYSLTFRSFFFSFFFFFYAFISYMLLSWYCLVYTVFFFQWIYSELTHLFRNRRDHMNRHYPFLLLQGFKIKSGYLN